MKLSRPQYNHIRLDTNLILAKSYHVIKCQMGFHPFLSPPDNESPEYIIGARCTVVFYIDSPENEVAGYLGEVASAILSHINPHEDRKTLLFFVKDTFSSIVEFLRKELPTLDVNFIPPPDYPVLVEDWLKLLDQQGLYK